MPQNKPFSYLFFVLILALGVSSAQAQIQPSSLPMETVLEGFAMPADDVVLTVILNMEKDWYTYSNIPSDMGKPTRLTATAADGTPLTIFYPEGTDKTDPFDPDAKVKAYKSGTRMFILVPSAVAEPFPIALNLDMLLCHPTKCVPARLDLTYKKDMVEVALPDATAQPWWDTYRTLTAQHAGTTQSQPEQTATKTQPAMAEWRFEPTYLQPGLEVQSLIPGVLMGLLAGLILNLMPCVLPVVSIKLSALLGAAQSAEGGGRYHTFREHNVYFVLGILTFFLFLAVVLGATGKAWGALFQYRWLVLAMAAVVMALGASLFGLFHLPVIDLKFGADHTTPRRQAFFTGMLTTLLATPCSGPFLGGVLSWALIQGPAVIITIFLAIGAGMASPYLLLAINPKLAQFLPKPGPWIEFVEKGIGFFLMGTAFYLVSIALGAEILRILAPLWVILTVGWLWFRIKTTRKTIRWTIRLAGLALLAGSIAWTTPTQIKADLWEPFEPTEFGRALGKDILFVDFTADWCPTCKALEATVMTDKNVARWKSRYQIRFIKVNMTEHHPEAEALLRALGSRSIPTAALFRRNKSEKPLVLRDLFTVKQVENILESL